MPKQNFICRKNLFIGRSQVLRYLAKSKTNLKKTCPLQKVPINFHKVFTLNFSIILIFANTHFLLVLKVKLSYRGQENFNAKRARAIDIFDSLASLASAQRLHASVYKFTADFLTNLENLANPNKPFNWIKAARRNPPCPQQPDGFSCGFMVYLMLEAR